MVSGGRCPSSPERVQSRQLAVLGRRPHHGGVEDLEATQLMLQTLFDIRWRVDEIHAVVVVEDEDGEAEEEEDA